MRLELILTIAMLAIGNTLGSAAQAAVQDRFAAVAPATRKSKSPPVSAPPPSEHYAAAHANSMGHLWKFKEAPSSRP